MLTYARDAMIEEVSKIVLDDIVYIPLHHQMIVWAMRDNLEMPVYPYPPDLPRGARMRPKAGEGEPPTAPRVASEAAGAGAN